MALINNIYVLVTSENIDHNAEIPSHPTESGLPISDFVRKQPINLSISGQIVYVPNGKVKNASDIISKLKTYQKNGNLITYVGECGKITQLLIESFNVEHNNKISGGANFDMTLKQIRVANKAYIGEKKSVNPVTETIPLSVGNEVQFTGGSVYVSSDAVSPASERTKSVCKLTKISQLHNRKHIYHLISTDGGGVYGWVDASCVKSLTKTTNAGVSGGRQVLSSIPRNYVSVLDKNMVVRK